MPQILVAMDACTQLERLLPAALLLTSEQPSALLGVFAQDRALLHGAALPLTHEVGANSAACYPLTADSIEKRMRRIAEDMRRSLAAAAERQLLPWEFQIRYDSISQITSETKADVVLSDLNANWLPATTPAGVALRKTSARQVIVVIDEGSQSSAHIINAARRLLSRAGPHQLVILATPAVAELPRPELRAMASGKPAEVVIRVDSLQQLTRQIRLLSPTVMLLGRDQNLAEDGKLPKKLALIKCPLALVPSTW